MMVLPLSPEWIFHTNYTNVITPLRASDRPLFEMFLKRETDMMRYDNSWPFIIQFMERTPHKYYDGDTIMALAIDHVESKSVAIIRPMGSHIAEKAARLANALITKSVCDNVIVRYLSASEFRDFSHWSFVDRGQKYPQVVFDVADMLALKGAKWEKVRLRLNRFRTHYQPQFVHLTKDSMSLALDASAKWMDSYINRYGFTAKRPPVLNHYHWLFSSIIDYVDNDYAFGAIMVVDDTPVGVYLAARVSSCCVAVYANLLSVNIRGGAEMLIYDLAQRVYEKGYSYINLGHSDLDGLHRFKMKFNPIVQQDTFSVKYHLSES